MFCCVFCKEGSIHIIFRNIGGLVSDADTVHADIEMKPVTSSRDSGLKLCISEIIQVFEGER